MVRATGPMEHAPQWNVSPSCGTGRAGGCRAGASACTARKREVHSAAVREQASHSMLRLMRTAHGTQHCQAIM